MARGKKSSSKVSPVTALERYPRPEMINAIKEKLARVFSDVVDSEIEVVYVLVEIRKYLEQNALRGER